MTATEIPGSPAQFKRLRYVNKVERQLLDWGYVYREKDLLVRTAFKAGLTPYRIAKLTGLSDSTVRRILGLKRGYVAVS